jgi:CTP synthase (UTP-ammonia lyase)
VLGVRDASHEELDPEGPNLFITKLPFVAEKHRRLIHIVPNSPLAAIYKLTTMTEKFYGSFGVNPKMERSLETGGLVSMASEGSSNFRAAGIPHHPFFFGTLFVPQMRTTRYSPHPVVTAFLKAAIMMKLERNRNR